jgi:hypothetical protein
MTTIGTMGIYSAPGGSLVYTMGFLSLEFPDGFPYDIEQNVVEPISAMGVNNTRERLIRLDFEPFRMIAISEVDNYVDAVAMAKAFVGYKGYLGTLAFNAGGSAFTFTDQCYLWEVHPKPFPCQYASTIASSASLAMVRTEFKLQFVN